MKSRLIIIIISLYHVLDSIPQDSLHQIYAFGNLLCVRASRSASDAGCLAVDGISIRNCIYVRCTSLVSKSNLICVVPAIRLYVKTQLCFHFNFHSLSVNSGQCDRHIKGRISYYLWMWITMSPWLRPEKNETKIFCCLSRSRGRCVRMFCFRFQNEVQQQKK